MKKNILIVAAVLVGIAIAFGMATKGEAKALNVNEIGADPSAFTGTITFAGVMGAVSQDDPDVVGIMDLKELQCTSPNCNKIFIPVKCGGKKLNVGDEVRVTGSFTPMGAGYMFAAQKIKVVRNHKIGG